MKSSTYRYPFAGIFSLFLLFSLTGCMKDMFNEELVQKLYADAFPVDDIDPELDWKMTSVITAHITVYHGEEAEYSVSIYDANPLQEDSEAHLLAQSALSTATTFQTKFDCPTYLTDLYICRQDAADRTVVMLASINGNDLTASFVPSDPTTRAATRAGNSFIEPYTPAYSESELNNMARSAKEIKSNSTIKAGDVWKISQGTIFRNDLNVSSSASNPATIIIQGTWHPGGNISAIQTGANIYVTSTGRIELPDGRADNKSLNLNGNTTLTVLAGGYVGGENNQKKGYIVMPTGSDGRTNYNAGTVNVETIDMRGDKSRFYNCGTLDIDELIISNEGGRLTNMGQATIGTASVNSTIENGCFLRVTRNLCGNLLMDNNSATVLASYGKADNSNTNKQIRMGDHSMVTIEGDAYFFWGCHVTGPQNRGEALMKIGTLKSVGGFWHEGGRVYYEVQKEEVNSSWEKDTFLKYMLNTQGTLSRWGESPITIEKSECTGEGNTPNGQGKPLPDNPFSYTYVFEDNFPLVGDYDFNDVVIDVVPSYHRERGTNRIKRIQLDVTLVAAGASKAVGVGLRLVNVPKYYIANVTSGGDDRRFIESMDDPYCLFNFNPSTLREDNDQQVVVPIVGEVHNVFGQNYGSLINTGEGPTAKAYTYELIFELADQTRTEPLFSKDNLDFFICYQYRTMPKRMEVHLYEFWGYGATDSGTIQKLNLDLAGNNTWAVCVPYGFRYSKEYVNISRTETPTESAYPDFIKWARDRNTCQDWYLRPNENLVMRASTN